MSETDYEVGDVVEGFFSCVGGERIRIRVDVRYTEGGRGAFLGDHVDAQPPGCGPRGWGYDSEIREVHRKPEVRAVLSAGRDTNDKVVNPSRTDAQPEHNPGRDTT